MKLTKKEYITREEKLKDLWVGVAIFIALNMLMGAALLLVGRILNVRGIPADTMFNLFYLLTECLPFLVNIGLLIYFGLTRSWIALGMLSVIGAFMALVLLAGVIFMIYCFVAIFQEL